MRRYQQRAASRAAGGATANEINIPLPVKGTLIEANTAEVSGIFAGELLNWQSTGASLRLRGQHTLEDSGQTAQQRIPFEYGAHSKYLRFTSTGIDSNGDFETRPFRVPMDVAYISGNAVMVDGRGPVLRYDGSSITRTGITTDTGFDPHDFDGVVAHQDRLFFWQTGDEIDFYYGGVGEIAGEVTRFPLGRLGNITGSIVAIRSLTVDAGHGMNDTLAIFTSTGDIIAYEGLNPGDATDWRQLTRVRVAPPLSKEAFVQVGSDQWMLTASGVVSVGQTIRDSSLALVNTVSEAVQEKLVDQIEEGGNWSMHLSHDARMFIINRVYEGASSQFIYRTAKKAWDETDFPAKFWHNLGRSTQFTTLDGELATLDKAGTEDITARWVSGWFRLPRSAGITYLVPTIIGNGPMTMTVTLLSGHDVTTGDVAEAVQTVTIQPDNPADPNGRVSLNEEIAVDAVGDVFQLRLEVTAQWAEIVNIKAAVI